MKIHGVEVNNKNFFIPLLISAGILFLPWAFIFISPIFFSFTLKNIGINILSFFSYSPFILLIFSIPPFFIIKRLLSKKPKKVFYFELPILFVIYSLLGAIAMFFGLISAGPTGGSKLFYLLFILAPVPIILVWLSALTISLYFYYKKKNFFRK